MSFLFFYLTAALISFLAAPKRIGCIIITTLVAGSFGYMMMPAINLASDGLWFWIFITCVITAACIVVSSIAQNESVEPKDVNTIIGFFIIGGLLYGITGFIGSPFNRGEEYGKLIGPVIHGNMDTIASVKTSNLEDAINQNDITLVTEGMAHRRMQTYLSSEKYQAYGSRYTIGKVERSVLKGKQVWLAPIEINGSPLVSWMKDISIPGYLWVDAHDESIGGLVETSDDGKPLVMRYSRNLPLTGNPIYEVQHKNPFTIYSGVMFQIDNHGRPVWVFIKSRPKIFLSGLVSDGVDIFDDQTGDITHYTSTTIPSWVVASTTVGTAYQMMTDWGEYVHGWENANWGSGRDVKEVSENPEIVPLANGHLGLYGGVHSPTAKFGNEGFILYDLNTRQATMVSANGITEEQAESAIDGKISNQKNWSVNTAVLYRIYNRPTFLMTVTDSNTNFHGVGLVSCEDSGLSVFAPTLAQALVAYGAMLDEKTPTSMNDISDTIKGEGVVKRVIFLPMSGGTLMRLLVDKKEDKSKPDEKDKSIILQSNIATLDPAISLLEPNDIISFSATQNPTSSKVYKTYSIRDIKQIQ